MSVILRTSKNYSVPVGLVLFASILAGVSLSYATSRLGLVGLGAPVALGFALSSCSLKRVFWASWSYSFLAWMLSAWWLSVGINSMNQSYWWAGYLAISVLSLLGAMPYAIFGIICGKLKLLSAPHARPLLASAVLSILVELCPTPFPGSLVQGLSSAPLLLQLADWGGTPLVHFLLYAIGFSLALAVIKREPVRRRAYHLFVASVLVSLTLLYGVFRKWENSEPSDRSEHVSVALVQPNIPIEGVGTPLGIPGSIDTLLDQTRTLLHTTPAPDFIVWPEIPIYFSPFNSPPDQERLQNLLRDTSVPLVLNADMFTNETVNNRVPYYNVVQLFRGGSEIREEYRKVLLVPLGEYMPFEQYFTGPRFDRFLSDLRRYVPGSEATVLHPRPDLTIGTPVCLEALHTQHVARFIRAGARILINPSNDAYFGDSAGPRLNFAFSVFRAIEYRVPIVRVTNTGISGVLNQLGEVIPGSGVPQFTQASTIVEVLPSAAPLGTFIPRDRGILALALLSLFSFLWTLAQNRQLEGSRRLQ